MVTHFCDTIGQGVQGEEFSIEPTSGKKGGSDAKPAFAGLWHEIRGLGALAKAEGEIDPRINRLHGHP